MNSIRARQQSWSDFTEIEYKALIKIGKLHWRFIKYSETETVEPSILWRHDVDFSIHRAFSLAKIEADAGVYATYFILLHGAFYNPLEYEIARIISNINELGHPIGLHFDPSFYRGKSYSNLVSALQFEKQVLEHMLDVKVSVFSWHNPTLGDCLSYDAEEIAGMINAYGKAISTRYFYVSDSNGFWRHSHLKDFLEKRMESHMQVLTHPEWWVPEPMSPRDRIVRAANGRSRAVLRRYDDFLAAYNRPNVGVNSDEDSADNSR